MEFTGAQYHNNRDEIRAANSKTFELIMNFGEKH